MQDVAIYGAGGFGRETLLLLAQINQVAPTWRLMGFFDDGYKKGQSVEGAPVLGGIEEINRYEKPLSIVVAIAEPLARMKLVSAIDNPLLEFPVIAHPQASLGSESNWFGRGSIITAGCILTTGIVMGEFTIINLASTIGHDARIGSFCSIMPGCSLSGNITLGEATMMGTGAKVLQNISIGSRCKIGAGAVVIKNFGNGLTIVGVPAYAVNKDAQRI